jgi:glycosyltransferase involved in cell wall biosynthesis
VEALAGHMLTLFQDSQLHERMASASRLRAVEKFSVERMVLGHEAIIRKFLPEDPNE